LSGQGLETKHPNVLACRRRKHEEEEEFIGEEFIGGTGALKKNNT
jgi:hypothetical protein